MKKRILFILTLLLTPFMNWGQPPVNHTLCDNEVSTFWDSPSNDELPQVFDAVTGQMIPDITYKNRFNWVDGDGPGAGYTYSMSNMFFDQNTPYGNMTNIRPISSPVSWYEYLYQEKLMLPENGWELLLINIGRHPDNSTEHAYEDLKFSPYIVMYNRYQGLIRVYVAYGPNQPPNLAIDGVHIKLSFIKTPGFANLIASGLLRTGTPLDIALDQTTKITTLSAVAANPGPENKWYSADFQIAYDPCTCMNISRLALKFEFFSETDFALTGREITINDEDLATGTNLIEKDYLGAFEHNDVDNEVSGGYIIYKEIENAVNDYLKQIKAYEDKLIAVNKTNKTVKRNKAIANAFKIVVLSANPASLAVGAFALLPALTNNEDWAIKFLADAGDLVDKDSIKLYTLSKEMKKLLAGQHDFWVSLNLKEEKVPTKPDKPTISYSELSFKGKLSNQLDISATDFVSPGAWQSNANGPNGLILNDEPGNPYKYPIYNDVLGIFALLESPKIKMSQTIKEFENDLFQSNTPNSFQVYRKKSWTENYQVKLDAPLKYVFNKNVDIESYEIKVAFEIKSKLVENTMPQYARSNVYEDDNYRVNLAPINLPTESYSPLKTHGQTFGFDPVALFGSSWVYPFEPKVENFNPVEYRSIYYPINAFKEMVFGFGLKNEVTNWKSTHINSILQTSWEDYTVDNNYVPHANNLDATAYPIIPVSYDIATHGYDFDPEVYLKVLIDVKYSTISTDGTKNSATFMLTYRILDDANHTTELIGFDLVPGLENNYSQNLSDLSENASFSNINFNGQEIEKCILVGNEYYCRAWNNISIKGNINVQNGYKVYFQAGNEITVSPESIINPEAVLEIKNNLNFSSPMPVSEDTYVNNFCAGTNPNAPSYLANISGKPSDNVTQNDNDISFNVFEQKPLIFSLFPNPAHDLVRVRLSRWADNLNVRIYDLTGRVQDIEIVQNQLDFSLDVSKLSEGLYVVKVESDEGTITKNLIVK